MAIKQKLARKAVKTTAKHTAHGTVSRLKRKPARTTTLIGIGALVGGLLGWMFGRKGRASTSRQPEPVSPPIPSVPVSGGVA
jgi:uncharacterized protein YcfJ